MWTIGNLCADDVARRRTFQTNANNGLIRYTHSAAGDLLSLKDGKGKSVVGKVSVADNVIFWRESAEVRYPGVRRRSPSNSNLPLQHSAFLVSCPLEIFFTFSVDHGHPSSYIFHLNM